MIYVVTSILDGFDNLRPPACPPDDSVRYVCFTNVPNLPRVTPWEYRPAYIAGEPCRSARIPKILPHRMLPADAEYSIYHDGNFQLRIDPHQVIRELLENTGRQWAAHRHPCRSCVYAEAEIVLRDCPLVDKEAVQRQVSRYRQNDFQEGAGLWANGFIVRRHTPEVARLNELWWEEYRNGCERDQLAFPVARCKAGMEIKTIDADIFSSPWILFRWHAAWKNKDDNPDYFEERDRTRGRLQALARLTGSTSGIDFKEY